MTRASRSGTIGERLRRLRSERGLTQESLAALAAVSVDLVKKLEQGRRESARLTSLSALADALDVPLSELADKRPRLDGGGDRLVLGLRDALLSPDLLAGMDYDDDHEPTPIERLTAAVGDGWDDYWGGRFVDLARHTPALVAEARHAHRAGVEGGAVVLARAYQLAACLLVHLGRDDLALVGAERAVTAAAAGPDELQWSTAHGTYAWVLMNQARNAEAERVAERVASRIEPRMSTAAPEQLTVWGGMVLWAMAAACAAGRASETDDYLGLARAGTARMSGDRLDYALNFGPSQVSMQDTYAQATLGRPDRALVAAQQVQRQSLRPISYGRHLLDVAGAQADLRRDTDAIETLTRARNAAPVWFRHQVAARSLVVQICERRARLTPAMRDLARSLEAH
ncbi:helix-turn-helix transcriptional regulator [Actinoplanes sp. NPDC023936]|uniref:helix-turn-helix domain-containing protein n=1 Tax=Actinoplanes sp. NPDC023936 TaxID=3154910 RepID=UPI0033C1DF94